jgi:hydrogenase maturation protease
MNINELDRKPPRRYASRSQSVSAGNRESPHRQLIVIGYGNTLRSDDGAGQKVAEIVDSWNLPQVRSLPVHQLTPELAAEITEAEIAIFVDVYSVTESAIVEPAEAETRSIPIHPSTYRHDNSVRDGSGHTADPHSLLCLAEVAYGYAPAAWWILIPALNFEFSEQLSPLTTAGMNTALQKIEQIAQEQNLENK